MLEAYNFKFCPQKELNLELDYSRPGGSKDNERDVRLTQNYFIYIITNLTECNATKTKVKSI